MDERTFRTRMAKATVAAHRLSATAQQLAASLQRLGGKQPEPAQRARIAAEVEERLADLISSMDRLIKTVQSDDLTSRVRPRKRWRRALRMKAAPASSERWDDYPGVPAAAPEPAREADDSFDGGMPDAFDGGETEER